MAGKTGSTIIIKRIKKVAGGHHGGAWKVAYADFVTAMMAFFLLMWLLNATTEEQRRGIADYFDPKIPISKNSSGGNGMFGGDSVFSQEKLAQNGLGGSGKKAAVGRSDKERLEAAESEDVWRKGHPEAEKIGSSQKGKSKKQSKAEKTEAEIKRRIRASGGKGLERQVQFKMTDEGLRIDITDGAGSQMFASGSDRPSPEMVKILSAVGSVVAELKNQISLTGHTDSEPFAARRNYSNWELSSDRAHAARRELLQIGIPETRFRRVEGRADQEPLIIADPKAAQNRRIGLVILRDAPSQQAGNEPVSETAKPAQSVDPLKEFDNAQPRASIGEKGAFSEEIYVPSSRAFR